MDTTMDARLDEHLDTFKDALLAAVSDDHPEVQAALRVRLASAQTAAGAVEVVQAVFREAIERVRVERVASEARAARAEQHERELLILTRLDDETATKH